MEGLNEAMSLCFKNDIIVYPILEKGSWYIEYKEGKKEPYRFKKPLEKGKKTNEAMSRTYIFLAKKLKENQ